MVGSVWFGLVFGRFWFCGLVWLVWFGRNCLVGFVRQAWFGWFALLEIVMFSLLHFLSQGVRSSFYVLFLSYMVRLSFVFYVNFLGLSSFYVKMSSFCPVCQGVVLLSRKWP